MNITDTTMPKQSTDPEEESDYLGLTLNTAYLFFLFSYLQKNLSGYHKSIFVETLAFYSTYYA